MAKTPKSPTVPTLDPDKFYSIKVRRVIVIDGLTLKPRHMIKMKGSKAVRILDEIIEAVAV